MYEYVRVCMLACVDDVYIWMSDELLIINVSWNTPK